MANTFAEHIRMMRATSALEHAFAPARAKHLAAQFGDHVDIDYSYVLQHFGADAAKAWERLRQARKDYFEALKPKQEYPA